MFDRDGLITIRGGKIRILPGRAIYSGAIWSDYPASATKI